MPRLTKVSVIIPTKNEEENINRCIKSIRRQNYRRKIEVIVVDNYSHDKTIKLAKAFKVKTVLAGPERSSQRNVGAKLAKGNFLLFLDADMELSKSAISECLQIFSFSKVRPVIAINEEAKGQSFWAKALALEKRCYKLTATWIHSARFFPRREFLALGGYDKSLVAGEDWDLTQRFINKGYKLYLTKKSYVVHYEPDLSLEKLIKKEVYYLKNIQKYASKNPHAFAYQKDPFYRLSIWLRSWRILLPHPQLTLAFLFYKTLVFIIWIVIRQK